MRNSPASCSAATSSAGNSRSRSICAAAAAIAGASARARLTQSLTPVQSVACMALKTSIEGDGVFHDHLAPALRLAFHESRHLGRRVADRLKADIAKLLLHVGKLQRL